ncbi:PASTA domain-containing protein [Streptomyces sp. PG2]
MVSTGAPKVAVPSVVGDSLDDATAKLEGDKYQFDVKTKTKESSEEPNTVLEQDPSLGTEVEKGSTITLTIAKGRGEVHGPGRHGRELRRRQGAHAGERPHRQLHRGRDR